MIAQHTVLLLDFVADGQAHLFLPHERLRDLIEALVLLCAASTTHPPIHTPTAHDVLLLLHQLRVVVQLGALVLQVCCLRRRRAAAQQLRTVFCE